MEHNLTASQYIKHQILLDFWVYMDEDEQENLTGAQIDEIYATLKEKDHSLLHEATEGIRTNGFETGIPPEKHDVYGSISLAIRTHDDKLIGWTCFYGSMYSQPYDVEWIENVYFLEETKKEKIIIVSEYSKI